MQDGNIKRHVGAQFNQNKLFFVTLLQLAGESPTWVQLSAPWLAWFLGASPGTLMGGGDHFLEWTTPGCMPEPLLPSCPLLPPSSLLSSLSSLLYNDVVVVILIVFVVILVVAALVAQYLLVATTLMVGITTTSNVSATVPPPSPPFLQPHSLACWREESN